MTDIRLSFLGGASAIGASSTLIQVAGKSLLVDCGVRFQRDHPLPNLDQLSGVKVDAILVTHAHSDHTGALPIAHEAFPDAPIYATPPTMDLIGILQRDALKLMEIFGEQEGELPLYTERQVESMVHACRWVEHDAPFTVGDIEVTYLPASHILGASMIHLRTPAGNVLLSGDYSVAAQRTVPRLDRPGLDVDLIVTESTYGNRLHADRKLAERRLVERVGQVLEHKGRVLIPAFAIGRAQEVLLILKDAVRKGELPKVPIWVDGMVRSVCGVYGQHERYASPALAREIKSSARPLLAEPVRAVKKPQDRELVLASSPCVIVASSGMLSGGPSAFYAAELARRESDAILITGYQDEESPGRALLRLAEQQGPRELRLGNRTVDVRCSFETYSLSAHADRMEMMGLIESLRPSTVVLVHGDQDAKEALARSVGAKDVVFAEDGAQLSRVYAARAAKPRREKAAATARPTPPALTKERATALLGPATGKPVVIGSAAKAWFGERVDGATRKGFVDELVALGVARLDAENPDLLWPLTEAAEPSPDATQEDEDALAEELKRENPKGRLLELLMRATAPAPEIIAAARGKRHAVQMAVVLGGERILSAHHEASTLKVAEQLAARELLERLAVTTSAPDAISVDGRADELKAANPKGRLLEACARARLPVPTFEPRPVPGGFVVIARLEGLESRAYQAAQLKVAEQAAAEEILGRFLAAPPASPAAALPSPPTRSPGPALPAGATAADPRMRLNELRQIGAIGGFGYEVVGQIGPPHAPKFLMRGWWQPAGSAERHHTETVEVASKKAGELEAAIRIYAALPALG